MSTIALLKRLLHLMNNCNCCCEFVKSSHSLLNNEMSANKNKKVGDDLSVCVLNILPKGSNLPSFFSYKPPERGDIDFSNIYVTSHWPLDQKSCLGAPCLVWCWYIFCRWRYVFYLSHNSTRPLRYDFRHIYEWELLAACHHLETFGDHRHSNC